MREHLKETEVTEWFEKWHDRAFSKQSRICIQCVLESTCSVTWYCQTLNLEYLTNATSFLLDNIVWLFEKGNLPSSSTQWHFNPREHLYFNLLNHFKDDFQGDFYAIRHHYSEQQWNLLPSTPLVLGTFLHSVNSSILAVRCQLETNQH